MLLLLLSFMVFLATGCSNPDHIPEESTLQTVNVIRTQEETPSPEVTSEAESPSSDEEISESEEKKTEQVTEAPQSSEKTTEKPSEKPSEKPTEKSTEKSTEKPTESAIDKNGSYTSKEDVALYIHTYGKLPKNFITKKEAEALGWSGGGLDAYADGKSIGGDRFGNREGLLPKAKGRTYTECDIDTMHKKSRGAKRIVFSNDGLIYYTGDHYETFTLLYGEE